MTDLRQPDGVQYFEWEGDVATDAGDFERVAKILNIDETAWIPVLISLWISGGTQVVTSWGIPRDDRTIPEIAAEAASAGRLEVTRLTETWQEIPDHADTNPPAPPVVPLTYVGDVLTLGFKRVSIKLVWQKDQWGDAEFVEVGNLVPDED